MTLTVEATYESGVMKLKQPLPLQELETVQITIHGQTNPLAAAYGIMGFKGSAAEAEYFAMSPELDPLED